MAGGLPADLVEATALTLGSVGRVGLPPEQWPAVQLTLRAVDHAVDTDDAGALRAALGDLRRMGLTPQYFDDSSADVLAVFVDPIPATPPPAGAGTVGFGPMPAPAPMPPSMAAPPPMASGPRRSATRARRGRGWVGAGVFGAALFAVALLGLVTTGPHNAASPRPSATSATVTALPSVTGAPSPTQTSPTESTTGPSNGKAAGAGIFIAGGLIAVAAIVIAVVVVVVRRRSRPGHPPPMHVVDATEPPGRPAFTFAPNELVELANRTVDRLVAKGAGP